MKGLTSVSALIEAVRDRTKTVDLKQVNAVLMQPHWRHNTRNEPQQPVVFTNHNPRTEATGHTQNDTFPAKHKRATRGRDPPGDDRNEGDTTWSRRTTTQREWPQASLPL